MSDSIMMYTIYDHPDDYPDSFVVRAFEVGPGSVVACSPVVTTASLDEARDVIPISATNFRRSPEDDPKIVETWME